MIFPKDIWGLLFNHFEINFDPYTLNALSLTCKKLNQIDTERKTMYKNKLSLKGPLKEKELKGRQDYLLLEKYYIIGMNKIEFGKTFLTEFPNLFDYLKKLKVTTFEEMNKIVEICTKLVCPIEDVRLVFRQVYIDPFISIDIFITFHLLKNNGDIVDTIMDLQDNF